MRWVNFVSLNKKAKKAFLAGDGKRNGFAVDGKHIAKLDDSGRPMDWVLVVNRNSLNPIIEAKEVNQ